MNLNQIPDNTPLIIDANIFIYANIKQSVQCANLLERCSKSQIYGILPVNILAEVMHIFMISEARQLEMIKKSNPAKQLSSKPDKVKVLYKYEIFIKEIFAIGLQLESLLKEDFLTAMRIQHQYGLLTNDALFLAVSDRLRIESVVTADKIFTTVPGLKVYSPDDLRTIKK